MAVSPTKLAWEGHLKMALDVTSLALPQGYSIRRYPVVSAQVTKTNCVNCSAPVKNHREDCDHCGTLYL